jgi:hypothetical protein
MSEAGVTGFVHHYWFADNYMRDSRVVLLKSEIRYLEREHGDLVSHWVEPIFGR